MVSLGDESVFARLGALFRLEPTGAYPQSTPIIINASDSSTHGLTDPLTTRIRSDNYPLPNPYGYNSYSWVLTLIVSVWM